MRAYHPSLRATHEVYLARNARELDVSRGDDGGYDGHRILPGVWSVLPPPHPIEVRRAAALAYGGEDARVAGLTAAAVLGWRDSFGDEPVFLQIPNHQQISSCQFVRIERTRIADPGMVRLGLRLASPARILVSCATSLSEPNLVALVGRALQRKEVSQLDIAILLGDHPRVPGAGKLHRAAARLSGGAESVAELKTLRTLRRLGFPPPLTQVSLFLGGRLIAIADFYFDGVAGFVDGGWHLDFAVARSDRAKRTWLESLGLQVVVTTADLSAELLGARVAEARAQAASRRGPRRWIARNSRGERV